jgi:hypothetical protein
LLKQALKENGIENGVILTGAAFSVTLTPSNSSLEEKSKTPIFREIYLENWGRNLN